MRYKIIIRAPHAVATAIGDQRPHYFFEGRGDVLRVECDTRAQLEAEYNRLCGPLRFEVVHNSDGAVAQWHCPCCMTTLRCEDALSASVQIGAMVGEMEVRSLRHEKVCKEQSDRWQP